MTVKQFKAKQIKAEEKVRQLEEIESLINSSIHELVFALQHLDQSLEGGGANRQEETAAAVDCLLAVGLNVDRIQEMIQ